MAFRFRHTLRVTSGISFEIGKRAVSLSTVTRDASVTLGNNSVCGNVGLLGTGMTYELV